MKITFASILLVAAAFGSSHEVEPATKVSAGKGDNVFTSGVRQGCAEGGNCGCTVHKVCAEKECIRNSVRYEYTTSYETKPKVVYVEKMEKATRKVTTTSIESDPWMEKFTDYRTEWRKEKSTRMANVTVHMQQDVVRVPYNPVSTCKNKNCCRSKCACAGQANCGCCVPNCGSSAPGCT